MTTTSVMIQTGDGQHVAAAAAYTPAADADVSTAHAGVKRRHHTDDDDDEDDDHVLVQDYSNVAAAAAVVSCVLRVTASTAAHLQHT